MLKFSKTIENSDIVSSYFISTYDSGITLLLINTVYKWNMYCRQSHDSYIISRELDTGSIEDFDLLIDGEVGEYLNNISRNVVTETQNKDQISFYFIPYELITDEDKLKKMKEKGLIK